MLGKTDSGTHRIDRLALAASVILCLFVVAGCGVLVTGDRLEREALERAAGAIDVLGLAGVESTEVSYDYLDGSTLFIELRGSERGDAATEVWCRVIVSMGLQRMDVRFEGLPRGWRRPHDCPGSP